jgi:hypothetical protein
MESQGNGITALCREFGIFSAVLQQLADVFNGSTRAEVISRPKYGWRI